MTDTTVVTDIGIVLQVTGWLFVAGLFCYEAALIAAFNFGCHDTAFIFTGMVYGLWSAAIIFLHKLEV